MANIAVVGGGLGGAASALLLARRGHDVTVFERDAQPPPPSFEDAWDNWERRGITQLRQSHFFMNRLYRELGEHAPDVLDALVAADVRIVPWLERMPPELRANMPDDLIDVDPLNGIGARRTTVDNVLYQAMVQQPGVTLRLGEAVAELVAGPSVVPGVPHVVGFRTAAGETVKADLVVDVAGRRSPATRWLEAIGARPPHEEVNENRIAYFTMYFRAHDGVSFPTEYGPILTSLPYADIVVFPADNGVFSVTCLAYSGDKAMRALRDAETFLRFMRAVPRVARWIDEDVSKPITEVQPIAAVEDRYRRFVLDGTPVATGLVAVGDASSCTNPALGRGASLAFVHARLLADAVDATGLDYAALAARFDEDTETHITPSYWGAVTIDRDRIARMQAGIVGEPPPEPDPADTPALMSAALRLATAFDARAFMASGRIMHLVSTPLEAMADDILFMRLIELWEQRHELPVATHGPERKELLDLLADDH